MKPTLRLLLLVAVLGAALSARAQTFTTWTGLAGNGSFSDAGNWDNGAPDDSGEFAQIAKLNSTVTISSAQTGDVLFVGADGGNGTLHVGSGGSLTLNYLSFGVEEGSSGTGTISNGGSVTILSGGIYVGDENIFGPSLTTGTTGQLTISSGGTVNGLVGVAFATLSTGTLTVTGSGSTVTGGISGGNGNATITIDDSAIVQNGIFGGSGSTNITITGGSVVNGGLSVGGDGAGISSFTVDNGSTLGGNGEIGVAAGTGGSATGSIEGGMHTVDRILVGGGGTNTLTVTDATLDGSGAGAGSSIGYTGGTGTFVLSDAVWNNSNKSLNVGRNGGTGVFTLDTNSTSGQGETLIGRDTGSNGTVNVTTGSTLNVYGPLRVGSNTGGGGGTGTLAISGASTVNSSQGYVGNGAGTTGTVTISGTGSSWAIADSGVSNFEVGSGGTGTVTVSNGATLTNDSHGYVGAQSNSTGSVLVTGSGSTWTNAGNLTLGNASNAVGNVTLADGGNLTITHGILFVAHNATATGNLNIGAAANLAAAAPGSLTFTDVDTGGIFGYGVIRSVFGAGTVVFNHTSSSYTFAHKMDFEVDILQKAGTTTLTGGSDLQGNAGATTISGGTLKLGIDNAFGSGALTLSGGTLDLNDFSQTAGTLTLSGNSFLDFTNDSSLILANSSGLSWTGVLTVLNFDVNDVFRVGTTSGGLTSGQLNQIVIGGFYAVIDANGYLSAGAVSAVPEPATYAALAGLAALALAAHRRRKAVVTLGAVQSL